MRVDATLLHTVCFILAKPAQAGLKPRWAGTGFMASVPVEAPAGELTGFAYLVTAAHVVREGRKYGSIFARVNLRTGGTRDIEVPDDEWEFSEEADVALAAIGLSGNVQLYLLDSAMFMTDALLNEHDVNIGDDILFCGLFARRPGAQANAPILRGGMIAAMPGEPIKDKDGRAYPGYLVEARSIGGLSGAPVLIVFDYRRPAKKKFQQAPGTTYVLGLLRGHWDHDSEYPPLDAGHAEDIERLNLGIAIVTPIQYLANLLYRQDLVKRRRAIENEYRNRDAITLDRAEAPPAPVAPDDSPNDSPSRVTRRTPSVER